MHWEYMNRLLVVVAWACLAAAASPWAAGAGTTGKITGKIVDGSGQPMTGVNVAVPAARLGALSDAAGEFLILNVAPGTYDVRASMIGRRTTTVTGVVVSSDRTTRVDLALEVEALDLKGIEVVAKRPLVDSDLTSTRFVVRGEDIAKLPVQDLQEVVNLQAGVVDGHFRGGRSGEVQYQVSGVPVNNLYDNSAGIRLDRSILQEVQIISGTFDAEYGQALSGVVNAILKTGGDRLAWDAELYTGDFVFSGNGARPVADPFRPLGVHQLQGSLSGPAGIRNTNFLVSGRRYSFEDYLRAEHRFVPGDRGDFSNKVFRGTGDRESEALAYSREWSGVGKITHRAGPNVTVSYEGIYNLFNARRANFAFRLNPDGLRTQRTMNLVHGVDWNHRLSSKLSHFVFYQWNFLGGDVLCNFLGRDDRASAPSKAFEKQKRGNKKGDAANTVRHDYCDNLLGLVFSLEP